MQIPKTRRMLRATAALVAGAVLAVTASAAAQAAEPTTIDPTRSGEIIIHKLEQPSDMLGAPGNGKVRDTTGLRPVSGAGFAVEQVQPSRYDLTTNAGWNALKTLTPESAAGLEKGHSVNVATDDNGTARATALPLGVYLVSETSPAARTTASPPFLVTVPMTDPESADSWMYTINLYPKGVVEPVDVVTPTPTPSSDDRDPATPAPQPSAGAGGGGGSDPGPFVNTGGGPAVLLEWAGRNWAAIAALASAAAACIGILTYRHRRALSSPHH